MQTRILKILHVEDDLGQRRFLAHHLRAMREFQFNILYADSESSAVKTFDGGDVDFVILDYHLARGNGLNFLRSIRSRDRVVPIIAVSGVASPEVAMELLEAGADDYLAKKDLTSAVLARGVREALGRADALRKRVGTRVPD